eukprot:COSAG01_NODE_52919_length_343_cov_0.631148_1_plen_88_part_10
MSGALIPLNLRGTKNGINMHIVDIYPTFAKLAEVDPTDSPKVMPLPVDVDDITKNIYGEKSYPPLDGVDIISFFLNPNSANDDSHKWH